MEAHLLFWSWFVVAVLFGIVAAADVLGNGPQAYIGGLLVGIAYVAAFRLTPERDETSYCDEGQHAPEPSRHIPTPPIAPRDILDGSADREKFPTLKRGNEGRRRRRSRSNRSEGLSILAQLRGLSRFFGK
jgi:hypothetical protein